MSGYSNLKFELIATGEQSGTWGNTTNTNIGTAIEQAIVGMATLTSADFTSNVATLTFADTNAAQNARALCLNIASGSLSAAGTLNVPAIQKPYLIINGSSYAITVKVSGQTGVSVPAGKRTVVYNNATDVGDQINYLSSLTLGSALPIASGGTGTTSTTFVNLATNVTGTLPVANGGTGSTTSTGTGSVVLATSPTLVTPALGTPSSGNFSSGTFTWPTFNQNTSGTAAGLSATLAVGSGGTGVTTSTGSGSVVLSNSPTLVTPALGTPTSGNFSTGTFTWPTFNQNTSGTAAGLSATLAVASGGTGISTTPATGDLDIGNGTGFTRTRLTAGSGVTITNGAGSIEIAATGSGGTLTSVSGTGTVNGISLSGTVTSSGNLTLGGTLSNVDLTTQVTGILPLANGGTGANSQGQAQTNLGASTVGKNIFGLYFDGSAAKYMRINTDYSVDTLTASDFRTAIGAGTGNGSVTGISVGLGLTTGGGTITTSGTISFNTAYGDSVNPYGSKTANYVLAAPNGSAGTPDFRALTTADISSGTLSAARGGTGTTSFTANGIAYASSTSALATGSALTFDGNNMGIGVTPSASWSSGWKVAQMSTNCSYGVWRSSTGTLNTVAMHNNAVGTSTGSPYISQYIESKAAARFTFSAASGAAGGTWNFSTAASGNAGDTISWTTPIQMDVNGSLLVGYSSSNGAAYLLQVNSQIFATSSTIATSDARYKENVSTLDGALDVVKALRPVQFKWKQHAVHKFDTQTPTVGFLAQEVQQVLADKPYLNSIVKRNECVLEAEEKDEDDNVTKPAVTEEFFGIAEGNLIAILTKAIQEQQAVIESLTARLDAANL